MEDEATQTTEESTESTERMYAGKFKTPESMEESYKHLEKQLGEKSAINAKYEDLKSITSVPDEYTKPDGIEIDNEKLITLEEDAKKLGLTQGQFTPFIERQLEKEGLTNKLVTEKKQKAVEKFSENGYVQLTDFVKKEIGLSDETIKTLSLDELNHFEKRRHDYLDASISTGSFANTGVVTEEDVANAYSDMMKCSQGGAEKDRLMNRWIKLAEKRA